MRSTEIRSLFLKFFEKKWHKIVPSSSLIPTDPSVLFTTAGMQQFKPYFLGETSPYGKNVASIQRCLRTSDIDSVGDETHLTFFEMLGNFSFGGYFKEEAIKLAYEFIFDELKLPADKIHVTVFAGDPSTSLGQGVPEDKESAEIWKKLGIPESKILRGGREDNFWGPTGVEGPCGPTTEIHIGGTEVWNIVFNEYYCDKDKKLIPLKQRGVDTGMGLERLAMVLQGKKSVFETDLLLPLIRKLEEKAHTIVDYAPYDKAPKRYRVFADHLRAVAFLIAEGIVPSNKERGYILRRILRRLMIEGPADIYFREAVGRLFLYTKSIIRNFPKRIFLKYSIMNWVSLRKRLNVRKKRCRSVTAPAPQILYLPKGKMRFGFGKRMVFRWMHFLISFLYISPWYKLRQELRKSLMKNSKNTRKFPVLIKPKNSAVTA